MADHFDKFGGRYIRTIGRDGQVRTGKALERWEAKILREHDTNEEFPRKIYYETPHAWSASDLQSRGARGTVAPFEHSFVYLDVGAWIGSKTGKWGGADIGDGRYLKRDLGIVCGNFVALLSFSCAYTAGHCQAWNNADKSVEPLASVARLVEILSTKVETSGLGSAIVRDFMIAAPMNPKKEPDPRMFVILGDMHVPVLDSAEQAIAKCFPFEKRQRVPNTPQLIEMSGRVPRFGRVDVTALDWIFGDAISPHGDGGPLLAEFAGLYSRKTVKDLGPILGRGLSVEHAEFLLDDLMDESEARRWWEYYCKRADQAKPADIFEEAGQDLVEFALRLEAYGKAASKESRIRARVVQIGDMLDFWVGFNCFYEPASGPDMPVTTGEWGDEFVRRWVYNALGHTKQGQHVARAMKRFAEGGLQPVYIYGNHDNYLGSVLCPKYPRDKSGALETLDSRCGIFQDRGVFIEHGHRWESANADDAKCVPIASDVMLGFPAPLGFFVTQAAFVRPEPIRLFEGTAAATFADKEKDHGQRLDQVAGAVERFAKATSGFSTYVMGHTHSAALTRVVLNRPPTRSKQMSFGTVEQERPQVVLTVNGKPFENTAYLDPGRQTPGVSWSNVSPDGCIVLEDKYASPKGYLKGVKDLGVEIGSESTGSQALLSLPPGAYLARHYLTRNTKESKLESRNTLVVVGLSIAGDETHREGIDFDFDLQTQAFRRSITLRWGFRPESFDGREAWFGLFRPGEADTAVRIIDPNEPEVLQQLRDKTPQKAGSSRPSGRRFFDVEPQHAFWGARALTLLWNGPWGEVAKMAGEWQVRAFGDFARTKSLGQIEFFVHIVHPGDEKKSAVRKK